MKCERSKKTALHNKHIYFTDPKEDSVSKEPICHHSSVSVRKGLHMTHRRAAEKISRVAAAEEEAGCGKH